VLLLAVTDHAIRRTALMDWLWPDLDGDHAVNALKVCIHRARAQLGESGAIVSSQRAIGLSDAVSSNYRDILALAESAHSRSNVSRTAMSRAFEALNVGLSSGWGSWEWFVPYRDRLNDAMRRIGRRLVEDALARGNQRAALHVARVMSDAGPFEEGARAAQ
jgi:DNA-binding SARP family transcriptional activator